MVNRTFGANGLRARVIGRDLQRLGGFLSFANASSVSSVDVDGTGNDFMVVYARPEPGSPTHTDVVCQMLNFDQTFQWLLPSGSETVIKAEPDHDENSPAVGFCGTKYVTAWMDEDPAGGFSIKVRLP